MTYTEALEMDQKYSHGDVASAYAMCDNSLVPAAVRRAISHANWFAEEDNALRYLAIHRQADEIRKWADEINNDPALPDEPHGWPQDFCNELVANWRAVADAIDECIADEKQWAQQYYDSHTDDDDLDEDELDRAFRGMYEREPDARDRKTGLWSLICADAE